MTCFIVSGGIILESFNGQLHQLVCKFKLIKKDKSTVVLHSPVPGEYVTQENHQNQESLLN